MKNLLLSSGATLSYSEFGDPLAPKVIVYCHGFPGTGEEVGVAHRSAVEHKIRIIAPTRPGIGHSDFDPSRTILSWPALIEELLGALKVERFSMLGISGGTPYALACISHMRSRIDRCLIVSGMGPPSSVNLSSGMSVMSRVPLWCAYKLPRLSESFITLLSLAARTSPKTLVGAYQYFMSKDDRRVLRSSKIAENMLLNFKLALHQGARGIRHDFRLMTNVWGFDLNHIDFPVTLFHGDDDALVPLSIAEENSKALKNADLKIFRHRGHFMAFEIADEIVRFFE